MMAELPGEEPKAEPEVVLVTDTGAASARLLESIAPKAAPPRMLDPVTATPELTGRGGRAWLVNMDVARLKFAMDPAKDGTLKVWVIEAPWAHPIWHSYALVLVHLRPIPGGPDIAVYLEGATHEFWLYVLDPGDPATVDQPARPTSRETLIRGGLFGHGGAPGFLSPMNFGAQFMADSDEAAAERVKASVQAIVDGVLSPDTDAIGDWKSVWGEAMIKPEYR